MSTGSERGMPLVHWLDRRRDPLSAELVDALLGPSGSNFRAWGEEQARAIVARALSALSADAADGGTGKLRLLLGDILDELMPKGLGFYDLRLLLSSLRRVLLARLAEAPDIGAQDVQWLETWLFEAAQIGAGYFVAERENAFQRRAVELEVKRLESQLAELQAAYDEKTRLLDQIRQASTPIAPVYEGILVVPLVGVLDAVRAQALTEKLLDTVVRARAEVVILDVSGVPIFDIDTAQHLLNTAKAAQLLGAELVLVGISSEIARRVITLEVDFRQLITKGSLQDGLAYALARRRLCIAPASPRIGFRA